MNKNDYQNLSAYEKLKLFQKAGCCGYERHDIAIYLNALRKNDIDIINQYERFLNPPYFGNLAHRIIENKIAYDDMLRFGFSEIVFDKYGWIETPKLLDIEIIEFPHKKEWNVFNGIEIGRGLNYKYTYGIHHYNGGYSSSISGNIFDTKKDCLIAAHKEFLSTINRTLDRACIPCDLINPQKKMILRVIDKIDELTGKKAIQLPLFH